MKRFLLYLSALFVGVSFATAQETYEISSETGILNNATGKSSVWTSTELAGLTLTASCDGAAVSSIEKINASAAGLALYGGHNISGVGNCFSVTYTVAVPENSGYKITGYSMNFTGYCSGSVKVENKINNYSQSVKKNIAGEMVASDLDLCSFSFTVSDPEGRTTGDDIDIQSFTVTVKKEGEGGEEPGDDSAIMEQYDAIAKPTFGKAGNTTFVKAATLAGDVNTEVAGIQAVAGQACVTNVIEVAAGAEFDLNITYKLNWGDLAIYQIDNNGATKEYGYYYGSWEPNGSTAKVAQNIAEDGISVTEVVDEVCTATFPITINESHNPGDVIVVRAITGKINNATNSAFEQNIVEGGYVDFLFVVTEEVAPKSYTLAVGETEWATLFLDFNAAIPADVKVYTVTAVNDGYVTLTQVTGVLPAETGVIVNATEGNYTFSYAAEATANVEGNLLEGTVTDKNIEGEAYVLGVVDGAVGLYKALANGTSWLNNANKAYLPASAVPNKTVTFYGFDWDGTTGISEVKTENGEVKTIYDLTGRRVEAITAPGIYIVNGVKRVVR